MDWAEIYRWMKMDLEEKLNWMTDHGQSVWLNWGEDTNVWEVSWIAGGERHTGFAKYMADAVDQVFKEVYGGLGGQEEDRERKAVDREFGGPVRRI